MKKRLIALMLILTMAMTALAGCGDKKDETPEDTIDPQIPIVNQNNPNGEEDSAGETNAPEESDAPAEETGEPEDSKAPTVPDDTQESAPVNETTNGTLVVGVNAAFPPYEYYENGELKGLDIELATALAKNMGMNVIFKNMEFSALLPAVQEGDIDVAISTITASENRNTFAQFTDAYYTLKLTAVVKTTSAVATLDDMPRNTVAVVEGSSADYYYSAENPEAEVLRYPNAQKAFNALKNDKVDCVLLTDDQAQEYAGGKKKYYTIPYLSEDYVMALGLRDNELLGQLNTALSALKASGAIETMADNYLN